MLWRVIGGGRHTCAGVHSDACISICIMCECCGVWSVDEVGHLRRSHSDARKRLPVIARKAREFSSGLFGHFLLRGPRSMYFSIFESQSGIYCRCLDPSSPLYLGGLCFSINDAAIVSTSISVHIECVQCVNSCWSEVGVEMGPSVQSQIFKN